MPESYATHTAHVPTTSGTVVGVSCYCRLGCDHDYEEMGDE